MECIPSFVVCLESFPPYTNQAVSLTRFCFVHNWSFNLAGAQHSLVWLCGVKMVRTNFALFALSLGAGAFSVFLVSL